MICPTAGDEVLFVVEYRIDLRRVGELEDIALVGFLGSEFVELFFVDDHEVVLVYLIAFGDVLVGNLFFGLSVDALVLMGALDFLLSWRKLIAWDWMAE